MPRNFDDYFGGAFLKAGNFPQPEKLLITKVTDEEVGKEKEKKLVVHFKGKEQRLALNKTNGRAIAKVAGTGDIDAWAGTWVVLFATTCDFGGETVDCIRIRAPKKATVEEKAAETAAMQANEPEDDELPF